MTAVTETLFEDHKRNTEIMSAIADVQLSTNTVPRRVSLLSSDAMMHCKYLNIFELLYNYSMVSILLFFFP